MNMLGIAGSLRAGSINRALLKACVELVPSGCSLTLHELNGIALYDDDHRQRETPAAVASLCAAISAADAVIIATPEYNYSIPGVLKNAIDWASRMSPQPFDNKAVSIMGASPGRLGTARAQYHLRQVFVFLNAQVLNKPEIMVAGAGALFDSDDRLTDSSTRTLIAQHLAALREHAMRVNA